MNRCPFLCHPERTQISYFTALPVSTYVVIFKENHMQLIEAAILDRKSGEAEGSAVLRTSPGNAEYDAQTELSSRLSGANDKGGWVRACLPTQAKRGLEWATPNIGAYAEKLVTALSTAYPFHCWK
jgi:hypothetical protein